MSIGPPEEALCRAGGTVRVEAATGRDVSETCEDRGEIRAQAGEQGITVATRLAVGHTAGGDRV